MRILLLLTAFWLGLAGLTPAAPLSLRSAHAYADHMSTPLMVLRFNQRRVYYEQPLYRVLTQAVEAKPTVTFLLVSYVPQAGGSRQDTLQRRAEADLGAVARTMQQIGIPADRIAIERRTDPGIQFGEVHLFVR